MADLATLRAKVKNEVGQDATDAQIDGWLNEKRSEMAARSRWYQTVGSLGTTVAGQDSYPIPDTVVEVDALGVDYTPYSRVGTEELWRLRGATDYSTGSVFAPSFDSAGVAQVVLYPAPGLDGMQITALYASFPADLVADADVTGLPQDIDQFLVSGAAALALLRLDERPDLAGSFAQDFEKGVALLTARRNRRVTGRGPVQIAVAGFQVPYP